MKKLLLLFLLLPFLAQGQQTYFTPGVPTGSTSFTPTFRFIGTDSLVNYYLNNANRWSQVYTAAQSNARFLQSSGSLGTNNYGAFYNNTTGKYYFSTFFGFDGNQFTFNKDIYLNHLTTYGTISRKLISLPGGKVGIDSTLYAPITNAIDTGLITTISGSNALTTSGKWIIGGATYYKNTTTTTALESQDATLFRQDILYATTSNTILKSVGVLGADFTPPAIPDNTIAIANIFISPTSITTAPITAGFVDFVTNQTAAGNKTWTGVSTIKNTLNIAPPVGQPLIYFKYPGYQFQSTVGGNGNPEQNLSANMWYQKPGAIGVHTAFDPTLDAIWLALGPYKGDVAQYAPANVDTTAIGNISSFTPGSGYTPGNYNVSATGGSPSVADKLNITVNGSGAVTTVFADHTGTGYAPGNIVSASGIGPGTGFTATVGSIYADIWYKSGANMFYRNDVATQTTTFAATTTTVPIVGATVQIGRPQTGWAALSGINNGQGLFLRGDPGIGVAAPIYLNTDNTGTVFVGGANGHTQFGSIGAIVSNIANNFAGSLSASGTSGTGTKFGTNITYTANGQTAYAALFSPGTSAGTGALTATITTAATSLSDGVYDNLASTVTSGSGTGQTWKVTVSGGLVTVIIPGTTATGGIGYAVGNTFTVSTVTGAVFTVASLGYSGTYASAALFNAATNWASISAPANAPSGTFYNTSGSPRWVNANGTNVFGLQSTVGTNGLIWVFNSVGQGVPTTLLPTTAFPALTGDVTTSSGAVATTIGANKVTYAKMQAMTANRLLGSGLSGTAVSEITLGTNLSFTGNTLNAGSGTGTVTSITPGFGHTSSTPITTSGTITIDSTVIATQAYSIAKFLPRTAPLYVGILKGPNVTFTGLSSGTAGTDSLLVKNASTNVVGKISPNYYLKQGDTTAFAGTLVHIYGNETIKGTKTVSLAIGNSITNFTSGFLIVNPTLSTATGTFVQPSPFTEWGGSAWGASSSLPMAMRIGLQPIVTGADPQGQLVFQSKSNAGSWITNAILDNSGDFYTKSSGGTIGASGSIGTAIATLGQGNTSLNTTNTQALSIANIATSNSGVPVQNSPTADFSGTVWNTSGTPATNSSVFRIGNHPVSGSSPTSNLYFASSLNGGTLTQSALLSSTGALILGTTGTGVLKATESYLNTFQNSVASTPLSDSVVVKEGGLLKTTLRGTISYQHTIFTPTTGGTVALTNNQYNIINPAGALLALTVNLPSSPNNNDVVYIKFTQNVTTVTYGNGTVVDGITAPTAGGLTVLTYDSGTTSWY